MKLSSQYKELQASAMSLSRTDLTAVKTTQATLRDAILKNMTALQKFRRLSHAAARAKTLSDAAARAKTLSHATAARAKKLLAAAAAAAASANTFLAATAHALGRATAAADRAKELLVTILELEMKIPNKYRDTWFSTTVRANRLNKTITYTNTDGKQVSFTYASVIDVADRPNKHQHRIDFVFGGKCLAVSTRTAADKTALTSMFA